MEKNVALEKFDSISEFLAIVNSREDRTGETCPSSQQKDTSSNWHGTSSWASANRLLLEGDENTAKKMVELSIKEAYGERPRNRMVRSVVGFAPSVPAYLQGHPLQMYSVKKYKPPVPSMELFYSPVAAAGVSSDELQKAGVIVLSIVNALEKRGISVSLNIVNKCSEDRNNYAICCVNVKKAGMPLDVLKIAYCIANTSFFRRHGFRWYETSPELVNPDYVGYGQSISDCEKIIKIFSQSGHRMENVKVINFYKIRSLNYNVTEIEKYLGIEEGWK